MFFVSVFVLLLYPCKQSKLALVLSLDYVVAVLSTFINIKGRCRDHLIYY
jgi:hypothetical protein